MEELSTNLKKAIMLLKSLILHYHGLDDDEKAILVGAAERMNSEKELEWANNFISEDYLSAFERSKDYFSKNLALLPNKEKLQQLKNVWEDNYKKGYVTEMETTAILTLAKIWGVEKEFMSIIQE